MKDRLKIEIPKNFSNCEITLDNAFYADNNVNNADFKNLKFPLPDVGEKNWVILSYERKNKYYDIVNLKIK